MQTVGEAGGPELNAVWSLGEGALHLGELSGPRRTTQKGLSRVFVVPFAYFTVSTTFLTA